MEKWTDKWIEIHYRESTKQIGRLAIEKQRRKEDWWREWEESVKNQPETD